MRFSTGRARVVARSSIRRAFYRGSGRFLTHSLQSAMIDRMAIVTPSPAAAADPAVEAVEDAPRRLRRPALGLRRHRAAEPIRKARIGSINYAVRAPLLRWLEYEAGLAAQRYGRYRALDVGCGTKPYEAFFDAPRSTSASIPPEGRPDRLGRADPGRGRDVRGRSLQPGAGALPRPGPRRSGSCGASSRPAAASSSRRTACRCTTRHRSTSGAGRTRAWSTSSGRTGSGRR